MVAGALLHQRPTGLGSLPQLGVRIGKPEHWPIWGLNLQPDPGRLGPFQVSQQAIAGNHSRHFRASDSGRDPFLHRRPFASPHLYPQRLVAQLELHFKLMASQQPRPLEGYQ